MRLFIVPTAIFLAGSPWIRAVVNEGTARATVSNAVSGECATPEIPQDPLRSLRRIHPRVLIQPSDVTFLKRELQRGGILAQWHSNLGVEAAALLRSNPETLGNATRPFDLNRSEALQARAMLLGLFYLLHRDPKYAERLWPELEAATRVKEWRLSHFLTTAQVISALGIAYDWLYDAWTEDQRRTLRGALLEKGLQPALAIYRRMKDPTTDGSTAAKGKTPLYLARNGDADYPAQGGWPWVNHNWNLWCNGGVLMGALAVADEEPPAAEGIIQAIVASMPRALGSFGPDGGWMEGPVYGAISVTYTVYALSSLRCALGTDFGLSDLVDFGRIGGYMEDIHGPTDLGFNFADATLEKRAGFPPLFWMADASKSPALASKQLALASRAPRPLDLLWGAAWAEHPPTTGVPPKARMYRKVEVAVMRSAWQDPRALFLACLGGDHTQNHQHLDFGSFVLDALGVRWAQDLGRDSYSLPKYFREARYTYYRCRAEGHNTFVLNPDLEPEQDPLSKAKILRFRDASPGPFAILDLGEAYARHARSARRGFRMGSGRGLVIQDELRVDRPTDYWWFMHTSANIQCQGRRGRLTIGEKTLEATILEPAGASFLDMAARPLPTSQDPQKQANQAKDETSAVIRKLAIHLPEQKGPFRVAVWLGPGKMESADAGVVPLDSW